MTLSTQLDADITHGMEKPSYTAEQFDKALKMCAAIWGVCYPADREFDMTWKQAEDSDNFILADAADNGVYSFQVEGLLCKYVVNTCRGVPAAMLEQFPTIAEPGSTKTHLLPRSAWKPEIASDEDWEALRKLFYWAFFDHGKHKGGGFHAHDLLFADQAIDWLKSGKVCEAAVCSKLPENVKHRKYD